MFLVTHTQSASFNKLPYANHKHDCDNSVTGTAFVSTFSVCFQSTSYNFKWRFYV